jgi:hypothetical protein
MMKKIVKKTDIKNYCVWYLKEVQQKAKAIEMVSYALEHKLVAKNTPFNSGVIAFYLRDQNIFGREKNSSGVFIYCLDENKEEYPDEYIS